MKFYLSTSATDALPNGPLSVKVNNVSRRKERTTDHRLPHTPDADHIGKLNDLASKPPFCVIYRVKKYDPL
jgi:hypothetical protein